MRVSPLVVYTIGYEGRDVKQLFDALSEAGIKTLLDVRYKPTSRKPGLSKSGLRTECQKRGIRYLHNQGLGTPPDMMEHVRAGKGYDEQIMTDYRNYLLTKEDSLEIALEQTRQSATCLLCYEADARNCHRRVVAEELAERLTGTVQHL